MKKALLYSAMAFAALTTTSCGDDFLVIDPKGAVSEATLSTQEGIDFLLTAAYSSLNNMNQTGWMGQSSITNYVFGDTAGGDCNKGSQATDQPDFTNIETYQIQSGNAYILYKWNAVYEAVKRANNVLSVAEKIKDQLSNYNEIVGQARFIKAVWMFEGIKVFGAAIPYVTLEDYEASVDPPSSNIDESGSYVYIWSQVEADLQDAVSKLPETWSDSEKGRANKWAAKAMLAKLYMYWSSPFNGTNATDTSKRAQAKSLLKEIIDSGVDSRGVKYKLADTYEELFRPEGDWSGESIFDVQTTISGTQTDTNAPYYTPALTPTGANGLGGWGFVQPTYEFVNSFIVDANGLPAADYQSQPTLSTYINGTVSTDLSVYTDPRLDFCVGRFYVPYLDWGTPTQATLDNWVRQVSNGGIYINKKPQHYIADRGSTAVATAATSSAKNYHVIRLAAVYLWYAECCIGDGDLEDARKYINMVRSRAANSFVEADATTVGTYVLDDKVNGKTVNGAAANYRVGLYNSAFSSADEATTALKRELRAEFGLEGHRWFDLARWGNIGNDINNFIAFESQYLPKYKVYNSNWVTFPIPITQIQTAGGRIKQNVNWE